MDTEFISFGVYFIQDTTMSYVRWYNVDVCHIFCAVLFQMNLLVKKMS